MPDLSKLISLKQIKLALDIGSFYTRIMANQDLVFNQPSCFLKDKNTGSILAIGDRAYDIWGKEPVQTETVFPLKAGVVYDKQLFVQFLEAVLKDVRQQVGWPLLTKIKTKAALPANAASLDIKIFKQCLSEAGLTGASVINRSKALGANIAAEKEGLSQDKGVNPHQPILNSASNLLLLDIGDQTTEIGLLSAGEPVVSKTLNFGSRQLTNAIQYALRQQHELNISFHHASRLKHQLPNLLTKPVDAQANLRGVDVIDNLVVTRTIDINDFKPAIEKELEQLLHQIKRVLSFIKSDHLITALENGIYLTGGGGLLTGLDEYLTVKLKVNVVNSEQPFIDVVKGVSKLL